MYYYKWRFEQPKAAIKLVEAKRTSYMEKKTLAVFAVELPFFNSSPSTLRFLKKLCI